MQWLNKFWGTHGDRLTFAALALGLAGVMHHFLGLEKEANTIIIGVAMLCYNKSRGTNGK